LNPETRPGFRESAAVVLVRPGARGLEVFWVERSERVAVMPGFRAFPGGKAEPGDADCPLDGAAPGEEHVRRACAIREAFEELGVLVGLEGPAPGPATLEADRTRLLDGEVEFADLARARGWRFRADALVYAGRWRTPPFAAVRFDTIFWLARLPGGQVPSVRPGELESGEWADPREALARWMRGEHTFAAPILHTLIAIAEGEAGLAERLAAAPERARTPVQRIELKWGIVLHPVRSRPLPPATHTNTYLVGETEMAILDPGSDDPGELRGLCELIDHLGSEGRRPTVILLTHHHPDHVGGVNALRERYRVRVAGHAETGRHVRLDVSLADGDVVPLAPGRHGGWELRAIHTPGHARGHLCYFHARTGSLFSGDHVVGGTGTVIVDPPEGDMADYVASLERLLALDAGTLFPGHGSPQGAVRRRIEALIAHRRAREAKVLEALGPEARPLGEILERAYADTPRGLWPHAERSLLAHLIALERSGSAARDGERWRRG
jgi:glyoxylase-like metal-dependent hydrolase (beta-lactamase superfamily II)/8-oxo-dGTP pyrophosphatase MutT (NUDIX family)